MCFPGIRGQQKGVVIGGSAIIPATPGFFFRKNAVFLYFLLNSVDIVVLKLTYAVEFKDTASHSDVVRELT